VRGKYASLIFVGITALIGASADSATPTEASQVSSGTVTVPVYFLDESGKLVPSEKRPKDLVLQLGVIPGSVWGQSKAMLQTVHIGHDSVVQLDLAGLSAKAGRQVAQLRQREGESLQVSPPDTQFARVATGVWFSNRTVEFAIGFYDSETTDSLTLLYFDRPCRLSGSAVYAKSASRFDYDVETESSGLVWMLSKHDGPSHVSESRALMPHPTVIVGPPEALKKMISELRAQKGTQTPGGH